VSEAQSGWRPRHNPWAIAMTVTLATFMEVLDTSIANVSLPHIAGNLSEGIDASTWVLTSYLVSNAVVLPISGWLSSRVGRKRFYMTCVALFTISSFLCGLAPNLPLLIFFRVLQGAGGGGLAPSEQSILADTFPPEKRGMAFAIYGMAVVLAPAIGPTLGGFITDNSSWRWIFFINVPVGIVSLFLTQRLVEDPPWVAEERQTRKRVDYIGLGLVVVGLGALQLVLDKGERDDWFGSPTIVTFTTVSVVCLVAMVIWELRHPDPIVDLKLLGRRSFAASFSMMFVLGLVLFGTTVLLPVFLQQQLGYTAEQAGKVLSPGGLMVLLLLPLVGRLLGKIDARWLIAFGFVCNTLALLHMTSLYLGISFHAAMMMRIYQSVGLAFLFVPITTVSYAGVPQRQNSEVSSMMNLARNIGGSVGISLGTTLLARRSQHHQAMLVTHTSPYAAGMREAISGLAHSLVSHGMAATAATRVATARVYGTLLAQASTLAYVDAIKVFAVLSGLMVPLVLVLKRTRPGAAMAH
jgi:DHA2 family multidrug resistance protein